MNIRPAKPSDSEQSAEWALAGLERNQLDPDILKYPQTVVFCAESDDGKPVAFLPAQLVVMLESLASDPTASETLRGRALYGLVKRLGEIAHALGVREMYFMGTDEQVAQLAVKYGFEELPWKAYRYRLKDSDGSNN